MMMETVLVAPNVISRTNDSESDEDIDDDRFDMSVVISSKISNMRNNGTKSQLSPKLIRSRMQSTSTDGFGSSFNEDLIDLKHSLSTESTHKLQSFFQMNFVPSFSIDGNENLKCQEEFPVRNSEYKDSVCDRNILISNKIEVSNLESQGNIINSNIVDSNDTSDSKSFGWADVYGKTGSSILSTSGESVLSSHYEEGDNESIFVGSATSYDTGSWHKQQNHHWFLAQSRSIVAGEKVEMDNPADTDDDKSSLESFSANGLDDVNEVLTITDIYDTHDTNSLSESSLSDHHPLLQTVAFSYTSPKNSTNTAKYINNIEENGLKNVEMTRITASSIEQTNRLIQESIASVGDSSDDSDLVPLLLLPANKGNHLNRSLRYHHSDEVIMVDEQEEESVFPFCSLFCGLF